MENRTWNGALIPPMEITPCGHLTDTPEKFYLAACEEADRLARDIGLHTSTNILDIGCGVGRLSIGLIARRAKFAFYLGVDVAKDRVDWCAKNLAPEDPRLHYKFVDMYNERYNLNGQLACPLGLPPSSFDIVYLYSVFSHLIESDVRRYLDLIASVLRPGGICFTTMFVADGVPPVTENPTDFGPFEWSGPLHCVLYERSHWHTMLELANLQIVREVPEVNIDQQTGYFLARGDCRRRAAGTLTREARTRRCFVGFFGLNRSLRWTHDSIEENIKRPLCESGMQPVIAAHFNCPPSFHSPRSGEFNIPFSNDGLEELGAELCWLEPQRDTNISADLPLVLQTPFKFENDPDGGIRRNVLHQLYSLGRLSRLLDLLEQSSFELFCLLRADLMYLDPVPVNQILDMIGQGIDIVTPSWHKWSGLNDRFAFCSRRGAYAYLNRREWVPQLCSETGTFHPESLLLFTVEKTGLTTGFTSIRAKRVRANGAVKEEDFAL